MTLWEARAVVKEKRGEHVDLCRQQSKKSDSLPAGANLYRRAAGFRQARSLEPKAQFADIAAFVSLRISSLHYDRLVADSPPAYVAARCSTHPANEVP
jgi:hypothetical protein